MVRYRENVVKYLTLIRGLPGAGKTSWMWSAIGDMLEDYIAIATDDWFMVDDVYDFERIMKENPNALKENHLKCQDRAITAMEKGRRVQVMNKRLNLLTIWSTIFLPLSFYTGLFGMNFDDVPFLNNHHGFWIFTVLTIVTAVGMYLYFKKQKWI